MLRSGSEDVILNGQNQSGESITDVSTSYYLLVLLRELATSPSQ